MTKKSQTPPTPQTPQTPPNRLGKKLLSITILIIVLALFAYYISSNWSDFTQIKIYKPILIIPLVLITLLVAITNGLLTKYLVAPFNINLNFKEWFGLSTITTFYNTIMPFRGGLIAKAAYLKKRHNFPFTDFIATMAGIYVINFLVGSFLGLLSLYFIYLYYQIFNPIVTLIFAIMFLISLSITIFSPKLPDVKNPLINRIIRVVNGWHMIKNNRKIIKVSFIVMTLQLVLGAISTAILYSMFNINVSFIKGLYLACLSSFSILVGITPAGLGINEAIGVFSGLVIGITPAQSISASILSRVIGTTIIFILGPIFSYILIKNKPSTPSPLLTSQTPTTQPLSQKSIKSYIPIIK